MVAKPKFVSWQPVLTDHQAYTFECLAHLSGSPMVAYVAAYEDSTRKEQGWGDITVSTIERRMLPRGSSFIGFSIKQLQSHKDSIHIFSGPFQSYRFVLIMAIAALMGVKYCAISEPYSPKHFGYFHNSSSFIGRLKALFRPILYKFYGLIFNKSIICIFVISKLAYTQFLKSAAPKDKLFLFGYFVPRIALEASEKEADDSTPALRLVFVGSLIARKGVDILIGAIEKINMNGTFVALDIYGPGDIVMIRSSCSAITYKGLIPFGAAQKVISKYDFLVLPSRYDGWGVVVNEAICAGVPVMCSTSVGAGSLAKSLGAGYLFDSENIESLIELIMNVANDPKLVDDARSRAMEAQNLLQPETAAKYLYNVILCCESGCSKDVVAPWYK